jgi:AcrR family transcriptional regulator
LNTELNSRILDVATRLFLQYGYKHTTVDQIVASVGIAKGSFYLHYPSKDAVFAAVSGRVTGRVLDEMARVGASDLNVEAKLLQLHRGAFLYIWDFCHQAPHAPVLWAELLEAAAAYMVPAHAQGRSIIADVIRQGQAQGVFDGRHDADVAAGLFQLATECFSPPFQLIDSREKIEQELPLLVDLLIRGLKTAGPLGAPAGEQERSGQ